MRKALSGILTSLLFSVSLFGISSTVNAVEGVTQLSHATLLTRGTTCAMPSRLASTALMVSTRRSPQREKGSYRDGSFSFSDKHGVHFRDHQRDLRRYTQRLRNVQTPSSAPSRAGYILAESLMMPNMAMPPHNTTSA